VSHESTVTIEAGTGTAAAGRALRPRAWPGEPAVSPPNPREARLVETHQMLVDAVARLATSDDWRTVLDVAGRLPAYSPNNCLLLAVQGAEGMVMGYHAWHTIPSVDGGHCQVRRGAKGLAILAPVTRAVRETDPAGGEREVRGLVGFRRATVFDQRALVAPPDLPDLRPRHLDGQAPDRLRDALLAQVAAAGFRVVDGPAAAGIAPANGLTDFLARTVTVRPDLPPAQRVKTLAHELAHTRLHDPGQCVGPVPERAVAEVEAESVAYLVVGEFGVDSADYTLPYLASWSKGDVDLVLATARRAVSAARSITETIQLHLDTPAGTGPQPRRLTGPAGPQPAQPAAADAPAATGSGWTPPPAPTPITGLSTPDSSLVLYSAPGPRVASRLPRVTIGTTSGRWELGWDPRLATFFALHHDIPTGPGTPAADATEPGYWLGTSPSAVPDIGRLEERLGFPLPPAARVVLDHDRADRPAWATRAWNLPDTEPADSPPPGTRPEPGSPVLIPAQADTSYRQAMRAEAPLRTWTEDGYRVDILAADPVHDPDTGSDRLAITYRMSHQDRVVFAGQDIEAPAGTDPAGDDTVRAVVDLLCYADPDPRLTPAQAAFLDAHAEALTGLVLAPEPPYPTGTRIAVATAGADAATGTVISHPTGPDGQVIAYGWRPDLAQLPGHPWYDQPGNAMIAAAERVRPTLAAPDAGLTGWTPAQPLAYQATVTYLEPDERPAAGHVLRAMPGVGGLTYDIQPDRPASTPMRVPANRIHPTAGTAYRSIDDLLAARASAGVPLQPGEVLTAGGRQAQILHGLDGPILTGHRPTLPPPAPPTAAAIGM
jgi:hypothetical protein